VEACKPTGEGKQPQGMGERLRFKFFKACEEQSRWMQEVKCQTHSIGHT
jgi:hypothetical protein